METNKDVLKFFNEIFLNDKFNMIHVIRLNESQNWVI